MASGLEKQMQLGAVASQKTQDLAQTTANKQQAMSGLLVQGNIDLHNRPVVKNADGSISTVRSMSFNEDGAEVLIPTVRPDGRIMGDDEAITYYQLSGQHLGKFKTPEDATAYAESLHNEQAEEYLPKSNPAAPQPGAEIDYPVGSPQYELMQQAIQQAEQATPYTREQMNQMLLGTNTQNPNNFNVPTAQPVTPEMQANYDAIAATKPFYRRMINPQVSPENGGTGQFEPGHPNYVAPAQTAAPTFTDTSAQYQQDLELMPTSALAQKYGSGAIKDKLTRSIAEANSDYYYQAPVDFTDVVNSAQIWAGNTVRNAGTLLDLASTGIADSVASQNPELDKLLRDNGRSLSDEINVTSRALKASGVDKALKDFVDGQREQYSPVTQYEQSVQQAQTEAFKEGAEERKAADIASGTNPLIAGAKEQFRQFVNTAETYGDKSSALTALIAESSPDILAGGVVGRLATSGAARIMAREYGEDFTQRLLATKGGRERLQKAAESSFVAYVGFQEAGSNATQTVDQIDGMSNEDLAKKSPLYSDLIKSNYTPEQAKEAVKQQAGLITAGIAGTIGALTGVIAAPFESRVLSPSLLNGRGILDANMRVSANAARETIEEGIQGASGQFGVNLGIRTSADRDQSLSEDIGSNVAESAIAGAGMSAVGSAISEIPRGVREGIQQGNDAFNAREQRRNQRRADKVRTDVEAANQSIQTVNPTTAPDGTPAPESSTIRAVDSVSNPNAKAVFEPISEEQISSPDSIVRISQAVRNRDLDNETRRDLAVVGNNVIAAYEEALPGIQAQLEAAPDEQKPQFQAAIDSINAVLNNPDVQAIKTTAEAYSLTPEEITEIFDRLPSEITPETYKSAANKRSIGAVLAQINLDANSIAPEHADRLLASADAIGLTPLQTEQLKVISATGKALSDVSNDVRVGSDGFKGIQQYQQGIFRALSIGDTTRANELLNQLNAFANHMDLKAQAYNTAAAGFTGTEPVEVINPATGNPYVSLDGSPMTYHPVRSKQLIREINKDAQVLRDAANTTAQLVDGSNTVAPTEEAPTVNTVAPTEAPATPTDTVAPAEGTAETTPVEEAPVEQSEAVEEQDTQTPAPVEETPQNASEEPVQGELFDKPDVVPSDIVEEETSSVETDLMDESQLDLGLDKGTNHDVLAALPETTVRSTAETLSEADKNYQSTNQVKKWFKPTGKRSLFLRTANFSGRLSELFSNGQNPITQLQNFVKGFVDPDAINQTEANIMYQFAALVPKVEQRLLKAWGDLTPVGQRLFWEKTPIEYFSEPRVIDGKEVYFLSQPVIEAMTAGLMQWFVRGGPESVTNTNRTINDLLGWDSKTNPTQEAADLLRDAGTDRQNMIEDLSREIFGVLGIAADINTPVTTQDAVAKAMAAELINVMSDIGLIQEKTISNRELAAVGSTLITDANINNTRVFVRMNPDSQAANQLVDLMKNSDDILGKLTNPARERNNAYIGTPPKGQSSNVRNGGGQAIPEKMLEARNKASKQPHYINMGLHDLMMNKLGTIWIGRMLGLQSEENANAQHLESIRGSNRTIERDIDTLVNGLTRIVTAGKDLATTPIYFAYNVISNFRMMLNSGDLNPQSAKLHRELVTVAPSTIQLNNPQHGAFLDYAIAQGLDISVDKMSSESARDRLTKAISSGLFRDAINILKASENQDEISEADQETLLEAVNAGKEKTKTLHALYAQAQYELAVEQGRESFQTHVMLELDGVTNGPFNAIMQLGLDQVNQDLLDKLEKGGFFYGQSDQLYNENAETPGFLDLYKTAAARTQRFADELMEQVRNIPTRIQEIKAKRLNSREYAKAMGEIDRIQTKARVTLAASKLIGDINIVESEDASTTPELQIGRGLLKNPVTVTVYSGGANAINAKIGRGIIDGFYVAITEAMRDQATNPENSEQIAAHINDLVNTINELTTATIYVDGAPVSIGEDVNFKGDAASFSFSPAQIQAINQNIKIGIGEGVNTAIAQEFGTVIRRGKMMVFGAALMHELFMARFNREVKALEAELRKAGKLSKYESLSRDQYNDIKTFLIGSMPIFNSWFTAGNLDVDNLTDGILLSEEGSVPSDTLKLESRTRRNVDGKQRKSSFSPSIPTYTPPGTRVMPLLVQSVEAAMQAIARLANPNNALNVFDGYINSVEHLESGSTAINQGVMQSWGEFNLFQDFVNRLEQAFEDIDINAEISDEGRAELVKSFRGVAEMLNMDMSDSPTDSFTVEAFMNLIQREAAQQTAIKDGLMKGDTVTSINQMTGANIPFNAQNGKQTTEESSDLVTPLDKLISNTSLPTLPSQPLPRGMTTTPPTARMRDALAKNGRSLANHDGVRVLTKGDVVAAIRDASRELPSRQNRISNYILDKILNAIPEGITVYVGEPSALNAVQQEMNPDSPLAFSNNLLGLTEGQNVYIGSQSIETVMHELIHTATADAVLTYYTDPSQLTPAQRLEIQSIEALMNQFVNDSLAQTPEVAGIVSLLNNLIESGNTGEAVAEFIAWGLSNPRMTDAMTQAKPKGPITRALKGMADAIKRLFAIGQNPDINSYWTRLLGHTVALTEATPTARTNNETSLAQRNSNNINNLDAETLYNQMDNGNASPAHLNHLATTLNYVQSNIVRLIKQTGQAVSGLTNFQDRLMLDSIDPDINTSPDALIAHGFSMSGKEQVVFKLLQASLKHGLDNFSPSVLTARSLYARAMEALQVSDFLTDPNNASQTEMALAQQRYDAVFGNTAVTADASGRSNRLANFMALVETNEVLRDKLSRVSVARTRQAPATNLRDKISDAVNNVLVWVSGLATKSLGSRDIASRLSVLAKNISHVDSEARNNLLGKLFQGTENITAAYETKLKSYATSTRKALYAIGDKAPKGLRFPIKASAALVSDEAATDVRKALVTMMMAATEGKKLGSLTELAFEFIGSNETNQSIHTLLTQKNVAADRARQLIRELVPQMIGKAFISLSQQEKEAVQRVVANTDLSYLYANGYDLAQINNLLRSQTALTQEINRVTAELSQADLINSPFYIKSAQGLGMQMVHGVSPLPHQLSNAHAIARLIGTGRTRPADALITQVTPLIDTLASLHALNETSATDRAEVHNLINREMTQGDPTNNGMTFTLAYYNAIKDAELNKMGSNQSLAGVKGYTPALNDPNKKILIASLADDASLRRKGYIRGAMVQRDIADTDKTPMYYYQSNNGGEPRWTAGVMSTLQTTVGGVNPITGRSVNGAMTPGAWKSRDRLNVAGRKARQIDAMFDPSVPMLTQLVSRLQPVVNRAGSVMGYKYQMPNANRDAHLNTDQDFTKVMGAWEGRIAEEVQAQKYNNILLEKLYAQFRQDAREGKADQYLTINAQSTDHQLKEIYELMPIEMKEAAKKIWPNGDIKVRKDLLNNAFGFREPSILNMWTGQTNLPKAFQDAFVGIAETFLGKNAARYLRLGERGIMELVKEAKNWIVVRSVVVSAANIISNMVHLATVGVSPVTMAKDMSTAVLAAEEYRRNQKEITELTHYLATGYNPTQHSKYQTRISELRDSQARNPVADLIQAGLLPTIAEDLGQQDDYSLRDKLFSKLETYTNKLPQGVQTAGKELLLAQNSNVFFLLNRSIQYGDFVAKYSLYKNLTTRKVNPMNKEAALARVMDEFINYDVLPSRTRAYLDAMGITWFLNYKIRIQKIILRTFRENPLRAIVLASGISAESGLPNIMEANLITGSMDYNLSPGQGLNGFTLHPFVTVF